MGKPRRVRCQLVLDAVGKKLIRCKNPARHHATAEEIAEWEMQEASAELQAADAEYERLMRIKPLPVEAWDASERRYECHKKLWLMFGGAPCNVRMNTMFNQYCERLLKPHKADA